MYIASHFELAYFLHVDGVYDADEGAFAFAVAVAEELTAVAVPEYLHSFTWEFVEALDVVQQQMVEPNSVDEGESEAITVWVHHSRSQDVGVVFLELRGEMLANKASVGLDVPYAHSVLAGLGEHYQWFGLANAHSSLGKLADKCLAWFKG